MTLLIRMRSNATGTESLRKLSRNQAGRDMLRSTDARRVHGVSLQVVPKTTIIAVSAFSIEKVGPLYNDMSLRLPRTYRLR